MKSGSRWLAAMGKEALIQRSCASIAHWLGQVLICIVPVSGEPGLTFNRQEIAQIDLDPAAYWQARHSS
jgi:hypothetical protein